MAVVVVVRNALGRGPCGCTETKTDGQTETNRQTETDKKTETDRDRHSVHK